MTGRRYVLYMYTYLILVIVTVSVLLCIKLILVGENSALSCHAHT